MRRGCSGGCSGARPGFQLTSRRSSGVASELETRFSGGGMALLFTLKLGVARRAVARRGGDGDEIRFFFFFAALSRLGVPAPLTAGSRPSRSGYAAGKAGLRLEARCWAWLLALFCLSRSAWAVVSRGAAA